MTQPKASPNTSSAQGFGVHGPSLVRAARHGRHYQLSRGAGEPRSNNRIEISVALLAVLVCGGVAADDRAGGPVAEWGGEEVPQRDGDAAAAEQTPSTVPPQESIAGYIFDVPVPANNYYFAKRVALMFPRPGEDRLSMEERERVIWEALMLHYEAFRQGIIPSDDQLEEGINGVLKSQQQAFTRRGEPAAYARWVKDVLGEDVELFENQMRYLFAIDLLKERMRGSFAVTVTEQEMREEFLNEKHHVGGEMVTFDAKEEAQAFYERVRDPKQWEEMKKAGAPNVRPVSLMTLEAYMDLWGISKEQIYAFHDLPIGAVGPPMPFGKQWCVYRLLEKRSGDLAEFPKERAAYEQQLTVRKRYEALKRWLEDLKASARLHVLPLNKP